MKECNQNFVKIICKEQSKDGKLFVMDGLKTADSSKMIILIVYIIELLWCTIRYVKDILNFSTGLQRNNGFGYVRNYASLLVNDRLWSAFDKLSVKLDWRAEIITGQRNQADWFLYLAVAKREKRDISDISAGIKLNVIIIDISAVNVYLVRIFWEQTRELKLKYPRNCAFW